MQPCKRAIICLDGDPPSRKTISSTLDTEDLIVAADGGANWLFDYGIKPHVIIGDLDGVRKKSLSKMKSSEIVQIKDQYSTDLEKVFAWVIQKKIKEVVVLGVAGKRIDHALSNFFLLWKFHSKMMIEVLGDDWHGFFLSNQKQIFNSKKGSTISLIPFSNCKGIFLKGFQYPLSNASMKLGEVGVSNVAKANNVQIEIKRGRMLALFMGRI